VWSPDSQRVIFSSTRSGGANLYTQAADGTGAVERLTESRNPQFPYAVTPDGNAILFREDASASPDRPDLMLLLLPPPLRPAPFGGNEAPTPVIQTMFAERNAELAPNGQWLAYESNESRRSRSTCVRSRMWIPAAGKCPPVAAPDPWGAERRRALLRPPRRQHPKRSRRQCIVLAQRHADEGITRGLPSVVTRRSRAHLRHRPGKRFLMIKAGSGDSVPAPEKFIIVENWLTS
jgi:hypothetical protein